MKKMIIFDPAMCCSTGVCGPGVDSELLRVSTALNTLKRKGIIVERYNLTSDPQAFVDNKIINEILNSKGLDDLPVTIVDEIVVKTKKYPTNEELCQLLEIPESYLKAVSLIDNNNCGCDCDC